MRLVPDSFAAPLASYSLIEIWEKGYAGTCPFCGAHQPEHDLITTPFRVELSEDWYGCRACGRRGSASRLAEDYTLGKPGDSTLHRWDSPAAPDAETLRRVKETVDLRSYMEYAGINTHEYENEAFQGADCPFDRETLHDLRINPESRTFRCFGCGESGDIVSFVQKLKRLNYRDAVDYLASFEVTDGRLMRRSSRAPKL